MRKLLTTLIFAALAFAINAQITITVSGLVFDANGVGVPNVNLEISIPGNTPTQPGYTSTVTTNSNGYYGDTITLNQNASQGIVFITMFDCNGNVLTATASWWPGNENVVADFEYCASGSGNNCDVSIELDSTLAGGLVLIANASGSGPYTYLWNTGETSQSIAYSPNGLLYCVTLTDANGCTAEDCYPSGGGNNCSVEIELDSTAAGGLGLTAVPTGNAPFSFEWSNGETTQTISLDPNISLYCVTITDTDGCTAESCFQVSNPGNCSVIIQLDTTSANTPILVAMPSGVAPFTYLWNTGETTQSIPYTPLGIVYCVTIMDATGCAATACYTFGGGGNCSVEIELDSTGTGLILTANASGTAPFTYLWDTGELTQSIAVTPNSAGHCVTITDANGCSATDCFQFGGGNNCGVSLSYFCPPGSTPVISASAWGQAPFTYLWSTGETTESIVPSDSGTYCVTITDANDCEASSCITVMVWPNDSCSVNIEVVQGGAWLYANATGVAPITYMWSNGEVTPDIQIDPNISNYCVTITDADGCQATDCFDLTNGCEVEITLSPVFGGLFAFGTGAGPFSYLWSTGETTESILPNAPGEYCVTLTDALGCEAEDCIIWGDTTCFVTIQVDSTSGTNGLQLTAIPSGTPPFTYDWNINTQPNGPTIFVGQSGTYCVVITDANGCVATSCVTVSIGSGGGCNVQIIETDSTNAIHLLAISNSFGTFTYLWSTGETTQLITPGQSGTYCVTLTDATGCTATDCYTVNMGNSIGGWVQVADSLQVPVLIFGDVVLFRIDPNTGQPEQVDETNIEAFPLGYRYLFTDVEPGSYIVRAELDPNSTTFTEYLPTYYGDVLNWDNATVIVIPGNLNQFYDITLIPDEPLSGPGGISGAIYESNGLVGSNDDRGEGDPIPGVSIFLYDFQELPLEHELTNEDGEYEFDNLPWGTYKVEVEITGKDQAHYWVTIGPDNTQIVDLNFEVTESSVTTGLTEVVVNQEIQVFPNPTSGEIFIAFDLKENLESSIILTDITGKTIMVENQSFMVGKHDLRFDITHLPQGIYFLNFISGKEVISNKIVKQ